MKSIWRSLVILASMYITVSVGCIGIDDSEEPISQAAEAVGGETGCATVSLASPNGATMPAYSNEGVYAGSPDDQYNATSTACPHQFVVELTGDGAPYDLKWGWDQPPPSNAFECSQARTQMHWYGFNGSTWTASLAKDYRGGVWDASTSACNFPLSATASNHTGDVGFTTRTSYTKIRVATQSFQWVNGKADSKFTQVIATYRPPS